MPQVRDSLDRFRPAGAPGAAARAGVPADRLRELSDELAPVLAALDGTDAECARILARARDEAQRITAAAGAQAAAILADADQRANTAREAATRQSFAAARTAAGRAVADAERQAADMCELAERRIPVLAGRAVDLIRELRDPS
jgi:vacuolar-type H+-ATPase subunit H